MLRACASPEIVLWSLSVMKSTPWPRQKVTRSGISQRPSEWNVCAWRSPRYQPGPRPPVTGLGPRGCFPLDRIKRHIHRQRIVDRLLRQQAKDLHKHHPAPGRDQPVDPARRRPHRVDRDSFVVRLRDLEARPVGVEDHDADLVRQLLARSPVRAVAEGEVNVRHPLGHVDICRPHLLHVRRGERPPQFDPLWFSVHYPSTFTGACSASASSACRPTITAYSIGSTTQPAAAS